MATHSLRPYVLVGDGAFQMTGAEVSTAVRLGLNPIIMVLNNDGYGTMRKIREGWFNVITQWNYSKICDLVGGGKGITASTNGEFDDALSRAQKSDRVHVIEVRISRDDASHQLATIAAEVRKVRGGKLHGSQGIKPRRTVLATSERVSVQYHRYDSIQFRDFLEALAAAKITPKRFRHPNPHAPPKPLKKGERSRALTMVDVFRILSLHLDERCCVIADIGDAIFGAVGIRSARQAQFIAPAYYMSMGFAVPASIGVAMAAKKLRPYVLVGDGAFQMTGAEVSTAVRLGLNPIIIVLNNDGYGTRMRKIREGCFNVITQWNYSKICDLVGGGKGITASTNGEFDDALARAQKSDRVHVIEVMISRDDASHQLARIAAEVRKRRGSKLQQSRGIKTRTPARSL